MSVKQQSPGEEVSSSGIDAHPASSLSIRKKLSFTLVVFLMFLLGNEALFRVESGRLFYTGSFRETPASAISAESPYVYDALLGHVPRKDFSGLHPQWKAEVTIDHLGTRVHQSQAQENAPCILAVGDSLTFGDEVNDDETWPAHMERLSGQRIVNGGVSGYGLDQIVLRAEQLVPILQPQLLIVSVYPDDIHRCEYSDRYAPKPYFKIADHELILENTPVPRAGKAIPSRLKAALGYSALADAIMRSVNPTWWRFDQSSANGTHVHRDGLRVCTLLLDRLKTLSDQQDIPLLFVMQPDIQPEQTSETRGLLESARQLGMHVLDIHPLMYVEFERNPSLRSKWVQGHLTSAGNEWIAETVLREVEVQRRKK